MSMQLVIKGLNGSTSGGTSVSAVTATSVFLDRSGFGVVGHGRGRGAVPKKPPQSAAAPAAAGAAALQPQGPRRPGAPPEPPRSPMLPPR